MIWWRNDMDEAPRDGTPIKALIPDYGECVIRWCEGFLTTDEQPCGSWIIADDRPPPDDWTDGVCWESNEDGVPSSYPTRWKPLPDREDG